MLLGRAPKLHTRFHRHRGRLALFQQAANGREYWREYWTPPRRAALLNAATTGGLGELAPGIETWLPKQHLVLEAGCGPGHVVAALRARGYRARGVDFEPQVVSFVNAAAPELDVRIGDVTRLDLPDASVGAYLSLGVIEHFEAGPEAALAEARRVVRPDGVALISVPFLNTGRTQLLEALRSAPHDDEQFHQYYFDEADFAAVLREAGFAPIETFPYAVEAYLTREHAILSRLWRTRLARERVKRPLRRAFTDASRWVRSRYGHMLMMVCRRR